jgi:hypothetical protein
LLRGTRGGKAVVMSRAKNAVLLVQGPPGWQPTRMHTLPPAIVAAEFYARNLTLKSAILVARKYNGYHDPTRKRGSGKWAVVICSLSRHRNSGKEAQHPCL